MQETPGARLYTASDKLVAFVSPSPNTLKFTATLSVVETHRPNQRRHKPREVASGVQAVASPAK
jgi:hypothetical protein